MLGVGVAGPLSAGGRDRASVSGSARCRPPMNATPGPCWPGFAAWGRSGSGRCSGGTGAVGRSSQEAASPGGIERLAGTTLDEAMSAGERRPRRLAIDLATAIAEAGEHAGATLRRIEALGLRIVTIEDAAYPRRLAAVEMPPHVLYVLGEPAALGARLGGGHRRDPPRHRCGPAHRRADRRRPRGRRRERHLGPGGRHRRCRARGGGPRPWHDRGRHRIRPWRSPSARSRTAGGVHRRGRRRDRVRARTRCRTEPRHVPAPQPDHQRARGRDRGRRGSGAERGADHGVVGARAGSGVLPRPRRPRGSRRRPGAWPSCASSRRARGSWPGSRS